MLPKDTDERIIQLISQNADLTYKEIAGKLRLNESTARKRVLSLRRRGIIKRYVADVDVEKMGYKVEAVVGIDVDPSKMLEVGRKLVAMPETRMVFNITGNHDFQTVVWATDRESLANVMDNINGIEGVTKVVPSFIVEWLK